MAMMSDAPGLRGQIEATLLELATGLEPGRPSGRGRPPILPAAVLWTALALGVLRGAMSQLAIWRLILDAGLWRGSRIVVSDEAVYRRLARAPDPSPMAGLFAQMTALLDARAAPDEPLAPFAAAVVALDETTLDPIARLLPALRGAPPGDDRLLPGKLAGLFDVRRQLWRTLEVVANPHQNEKVAARGLAATLAPGTLLLADLGYFGFAWFDELTEAGHWWLSRLRAKTSYRIEHVHYQDDTTLDALVWLGAHRADRARHLVRLVRFHAAGQPRAYLTNVRDPRVLPLAEIARLYARRWDIELAVKLVKRELGLHLLWSAQPAVILHQVWATLLIAQVVLALRREIARAAEVDDFDVSLPLMLAYLPQYAAVHDDPLAAFVADGRLLGCIRPSRSFRLSGSSCRPPMCPRRRRPATPAVAAREFVGTDAMPCAIGAQAIARRGRHIQRESLGTRRQRHCAAGCSGTPAAESACCISPSVR
jgi:hypothetical protein